MLRKKGGFYLKAKMKNFIAYVEHCNTLICCPNIDIRIVKRSIAVRWCIVADLKNTVLFRITQN